MLSKLLLALWLISAQQILSFTVMLSPTGDSKHAGRKLHDQYERGTAFQFAKNLERELVNLDPQIQIILSHSPAQTLEPLQIANFANHLKVDLFISLSFYQDDVILPQLAIYYFQNQTYFYAPSTQELYFYPYTQAYLNNFHRTKQLAQQLQSSLQSAKYQMLFQTSPALGIPFKPLVGIQAPGLGLEIGLKNPNLAPLVQPIAHSLREAIHALK